MSKSSKPGGPADEKTSYVKRLKAMNAPQKVTDVSLTAKQSEVPRSNLPIKNKRSTGAVNKHQKSKIPNPASQKSTPTMQASIQVVSQMSSKIDKRVPSPSLHSASKPAITKDQPEIVELPQLKISKKDVAKTKAKNDDHIDREVKEKKSESIEQASNTNGKATESVEEQSAPGNTDKESNDSESNIISISMSSNSTENSTTSIEYIEIDSEETTKPLEQKKDSDVICLPEVSLIETVVSAEKVEEERDLNAENKKKPVKDVEHPELNVVESTTSEMPVVKEAETQGGHAESIVQETQVDVSFVSYDSNIMLKDVQIKLNDCLRDNTKSLDEPDPNASMSEAFKDISFGRTLRGISGRSSISRLRNVTVRDRRSSPDDSLFVNTSNNISYAFDRSQFLPEASPYHNGSRFDRKRKMTTEEENPSKKFKTEESSSLLNRPFQYLKNFRRPVQVSSPNHGYKFDLDDKTSNKDQTITDNNPSEEKKWCAIM